MPRALLLSVLVLLTGCGAGNFGTTTAANSSTTTTTLAVSATSVTTGTPITLSATVSPTAAGGTVTFLDATSTLGTAPVTGGLATFKVPTLANGTHSITASYSGMLGYFASSSTAVAVYVSPMLSPSSITLSASPTTGTLGTNVILTATVNAGATGLVTFFDGPTSLGAALITNNTATYSTAMLNVGTHPLTAVYAGSPTYAGATSATVTVTIH